MTRKEQARALHTLLTQQRETKGVKIVCYLLDETEPFPAPAIHDYSVLDGRVMCIVPDDNRKE